MAKDPYAILGVAKGASDAAIKAAYRKLAKAHHPDLNPSSKRAAAKFQEISAAYALLSDKDKRGAFNRGEIDMDGQPVHPQASYRDYARGTQGGGYYASGVDGGDFDASDLGGIFGSFFRGGRGSKGGGAFTQAMEDSHYSVAIDFLEAALGGVRQVTMPDGRALSITIPEGIEDGQQLRLKGQGDKGPGGKKADAYVQVHIRPHAVFTRKGHDIYAEIPVGFHECILGSKIEVPTIHGPVEMAIPKGADNGSMLRLRGKGIKRGDQYVKLRLVMPKTVDAELEQAIRRWAEKHAVNPRAPREAAA